MSKGKQDDELSAEESQALLQSLNARASSGAAAPADDAPDEDLEAYLASLEGDDAPAAAPAKAAAPDPFADAFSQLEAEHGHAIVAPPPRTVEAPKKPAAPAPEAKKEVKKEAEKTAEKPPEKTPEKAADKKVEPDKKAAKKPTVHAVETVRSRKFTFAVGALKLTLLLAPALVAWWIAGALLSRWVGQGWIIAIVATLAAFVPAIGLKLGTGKGRVLWWAAGLGLIASGGLIGGLPQLTGDSLIRYGHWPSSTVAQLAEWDADHFAPRYHGAASAWVGEQIKTIKPDKPPVADPAAPAAAAAPTTLVPSALGTEQDLKSFADEARKKAAPAVVPAPAAPAVAPAVAPANPTPAAPAPAAPAAEPAAPAAAPAVAPANPAAPAPAAPTPAAP
jgi:hypothetical protein